MSLTPPSSSSSSSSYHRHQLLSQREEEDEGVVVVDGVGAAVGAGASSTYEPFEIGGGSDDDEDDENYTESSSSAANGAVSGGIRPSQSKSPKSSARASLSPLMNLILDQEEKRTKKQQRFGGDTYQHVLSDDHPDDDDDDHDHDQDDHEPNTINTNNPENDDDVATTCFPPCCRYGMAAALILAMFAALVLFVPHPDAEQEHFRGHNGGKSKSKNDVMFARSCRNKIFPETHSWQEFLMTMSSTTTPETTTTTPETTTTETTTTTTKSKWCRADYYQDQDPEQLQSCPCPSRVEPAEHHVDDAEDVAVYISNVQTNLKAFNNWEAEHPQKQPDVIFIGDDLVDRWHGQSFGIPIKALLENAQVFYTYFGGSATLSGIACGVTNDQVPNLLYRLTGATTTTTTTPVDNNNNPGGGGTDSEPVIPHHTRMGWLDVEPPVSPAIWWIVIGHNDILELSEYCSYPGILAGILQVVSILLKARPHATIVINSILPPPPLQNDNTYFLYTQMVQPLNQALECYAASQYDSRVEFVNVTALFTLPVAAAPSSSSAPAEPNPLLLKRNELLFEDSESIHPNAAGYEVWSQLVSDKIQEILKKKHRRSL